MPTDSTLNEKATSWHFASLYDSLGKLWKSHQHPFILHHLLRLKTMINEVVAFTDLFNDKEN